MGIKKKEESCFPIISTVLFTNKKCLCIIRGTLYSMWFWMPWACLFWDFWVSVVVLYILSFYGNRYLYSIIAFEITNTIIKDVFRWFWELGNMTQSWIKHGATILMSRLTSIEILEKLCLFGQSHAVLKLAWWKSEGEMCYAGSPRPHC